MVYYTIGKRSFTAKERVFLNQTKEKIMQTALHLFARDGYEAVSVSAIAGELGMTKGALYKHYANKRAIFDSIVERMYEIDARRSQEFSVPQEAYAAAPAAYEAVSAAAVRAFTLAQFGFWTKDDFAANFRRMLTLEQYRDARLAQLYQENLASGPVKYMAAIFRPLTDSDETAMQLALEFYGPMFLLYSVYDGAGGKDSVAPMLSAHIDRFIAKIESD